jgi:cyclophilin family peptidyl-prolyl cis-trans isomerase
MDSMRSVMKITRAVRSRHGLARRHQLVMGLIVIALLTISGPRPFAQEKKRAGQGAKPSATVTPAEAANLEAVITTEMGVIRFEFLTDKAPRHAQQFIKWAREGFYDGSAFFRLFARGLIQGGDPNLKEPAKPRNLWGTGALNLLPDEFSDVKHIRGTVSAARIPGKANSGGAQFFICASPQPQLDGQFSAFGEVTEGIEVVEKISLAPVDAEQRAVTPIRIISVKIEPKRAEPFKDATVDQMRKDVLLHTNFGDITLEMQPDLAPEHVRNFLKLVASGWYDHTAFHRLVPGFVVQGGVGETRTGGAGHYADKWVHPLKGEFSPVKHIRGTLSMARTDDPNSATTSFFIVLGPAPHLDNKYSVFGKVADGFDTLERIEAATRRGESPVERIELIEASIKP